MSKPITITLDEEAVTVIADAVAERIAELVDAGEEPEEKTKPKAKPKTKPKTKPKAKEPEPADDDDDDDAGDDDDGPTLEEVRKALKEYAAIEGKEAAIQILKDHGASSMSELDEEHYADVVAACDA